MLEYPTKPQPLPALAGFQFFALEIQKQHGYNWTVAQYHQAWANLSDDKKAYFNEKGFQDSERFQRETEEWKQNGGLEWNKKIRAVTEKGVQPVKLVGQEMRRTQATCNAAAVRAMTTATEVFIATMARETFLRKNPDEKKVALSDVHHLIHGEDARFGFLTKQFEHPSQMGKGKRKEKKTTSQKTKNGVANKALLSDPVDGDIKKEKVKREKKIKFAHRPKLLYATVVKLYEAKNPESSWKEEPNKQAYEDEFLKMKEEYAAAEEKWKQEYPDEYNELMQKRQNDRERSRRRKENLNTAAAAAVVSLEPESVENATSGMLPDLTDQGLILELESSLTAAPEAKPIKTPTPSAKKKREKKQKVMPEATPEHSLQFPTSNNLQFAPASPTFSPLENPPIFNASSYVGYGQPQPQQQQLPQPVHHPQIATGRIDSDLNEFAKVFSTSSPTGNESELAKMGAYPHGYSYTQQQHPIPSSSANVAFAPYQQQQQQSQQYQQHFQNPQQHQHYQYQQQMMAKHHQLQQQQQFHHQQQQQQQLHHHQQQQLHHQQQHITHHQHQNLSQQQSQSAGRSLGFKAGTGGGPTVPTPQLHKRVVNDDPNVTLPWKKVQVIDWSGKVEDEYYWNTATNATSWEIPPKF